MAAFSPCVAALRCRRGSRPPLGGGFPPVPALRIAKKLQLRQGLHKRHTAALASFPFFAAPLGPLIRGGSFGLRSYRGASIQYRPSFRYGSPLAALFPRVTLRVGGARQLAAVCLRQAARFEQKAKARAPT